jgi:hypothetical protein
MSIVFLPFLATPFWDTIGNALAPATVMAAENVEKPFVVLMLEL